ncbi:DUF7882 family protein [Marisediminicola senii]|uniref:DUF7882 family protein n=1 Tax=Marisediminicola senii TaxID=2711233 RepID=UPI0013E9E389|nr:ATP-dependent DNA ligase [Marisediminicola senii]
MGKLLYGASGVEIGFDDRVLAHLQVVIGAKLRRGESFYFSWKDDPNIGDGRSTVWLSDAIPLYFKYSGGKMPSLNREWVEALMTSANSNQGLQLSDELRPTGESTGG